MAQPSVACYFSNRKRPVVEDTKLVHAKKVLVLDGKHLTSNDVTSNDGKLQETQEKQSLMPNKIVASDPIKPTTKQGRVLRTRRPSKTMVNQANIEELFNKMNKKTTIVEDIVQEKHVTPPSSPKKVHNAMDKVEVTGESLKEIKKKMTRSSRLAELRASMKRLQEGGKKLKEIEKKTSTIESPKIKNFKSIELEVNTSPKRTFSPEKAYLSPKKDSTVRKNLLHLLSPTKNAVSLPSTSPAKQILDRTSKPGLTLPFKYRYLAEMFRAIDTVCQLLYNRKELITFKKLKPAVEEMIKRNLLERHFAQIRLLYPEAFKFTREKLRQFGSGTRHEAWELVIKPFVNQEVMTTEILLERRRKLFGVLLDRVKTFHDEFLTSLDPPMHISKDEITRWHPEFDLEKVPDVEQADLPQPPLEEKFSSGQDVLEKARQMFNCNTRMEQALLRLKESRDKNPVVEEEKTPEPPKSILKGIPKALLEKVRQKQAAKALVSMTRSADQEKIVQMYSRLPELARLTRNLFVSEKKSVLTLDVVVEKLGNCYRTHLTKSEMEEHLLQMSKEVTGWLVFHEIRNVKYVKLAKNADVSIVIAKLESLAKEKSEAS